MFYRAVFQKLSTVCLLLITALIFFEMRTEHLIIIGEVIIYNRSLLLPWTNHPDLCLRTFCLAGAV